MLFFHDQSPPQSCKLGCGFEEAAKIEELGLTVGAMGVVDRDFPELESEILELFNHLKTDGAGGGCELHLVEDSPSHKPVVTVDIAQTKSEQKPDDRVVKPSDQNSMQGVGAGDLVPVHHVAILCDGVD
jgi:hypothetical protein